MIFWQMMQKGVVHFLKYNEGQALKEIQTILQGWGELEDDFCFYLEIMATSEIFSVQL